MEVKNPFHTDANSSTEYSYDIAIIGGGMIGSVLALALSKLYHLRGQPLDIALIEAETLGDSHPGFDARAIALAHGSVFQLEKQGVWPAISHLASAIDSIHISDRGHFGMTSMDAGDFHVSAFGQVVELACVGQVLERELAASKVQYFCPDALETIATTDKGHILTLTSGKRLFTSVLVAADGNQSKIRQLLKQPIVQTEFNQSAVIANLGVTGGIEGRAWERFTQFGPMALLPMLPVDGMNRLSLVWAMSHQDADRVSLLNDDDFLQVVQQAFGYRAGRFMKAGNRYLYPLTMSVMPRPIWHRCVFIGNAAQTLHPIAGQGFNLGLRDAMDLLECIKTQLNLDGDFGCPAMLHHYLQKRLSDRQTSIQSIEALVRGFSNDYWPLVFGRNLGLRLLSWLPPLKMPLAHKAMGWRNA